MSKAPEVCLYCDGKGTMVVQFEHGEQEQDCGFCEGGKPLDTQEDWDNSWGRINREIVEGL